MHSQVDSDMCTALVRERVCYCSRFIVHLLQVSAEVNRDYCMLTDTIYSLLRLYMH
jgi:hypothetical protein